MGFAQPISCMLYRQKDRKREILYLYASYYTTSWIVGQAVFHIFCVFAVFRCSAQFPSGYLCNISNRESRSVYQTEVFRSDMSDLNHFCRRYTFYHKNAFLSRQISDFPKVLFSHAATRYKNRTTGRYHICISACQAQCFVVSFAPFSETVSNGWVSVL